MKRLLVLAFILNHFYLPATAQSIANEKMNIIYRGLPNPISISVPEYSCKALIVEVDHGTLTQSDDRACHYLYDADTAQLVNFHVYVKKGKGRKQVLRAVFHIKNIPDPEAYIGNNRNNEISFSSLQVQQGMFAELAGFDIQTRFTVTGFNYIIIRNGKIIVSGKNLSNKFDQNIKMNFSALERNDEIFFYNIYCIGADKRSRKLESFELKVTK